MPIIHSLLGMLLILGIAFALSSNRRAVQPRVVLAAFGLQAGLAALVLYVPAGNAALQVVAGGVSSLLAYAHSGVDFLFGPLAKPEIGGASFAISALPVIIFFASLISILYYLRIMPLVIRWIGAALKRSPGSAASNRSARPATSLSASPKHLW
jgi:CNT family concentrative nucleoside transporter